MFRVGIVQAQDIDQFGTIRTCRVRVQFPDRNQMISYWLPILRWGSQNDKDFWCPDIGEQVVCAMDEHDEDGCVLGTIFSDVDKPPAQMTIDKRHLTAKDSATFEYDRSSHTLSVNIPPNNSTINIVVNGPCNVTASNSNVNLSAPHGDITFKTNEHQDSVNGIIDTYNGHQHNSVDSNGDTATSQKPNQQMS